jgi:hypothetical protein
VGRLALPAANAQPILTVSWQLYNILYSGCATVDVAYMGSDVGVRDILALQSGTFELARQRFTVRARTNWNHKP